MADGQKIPVNLALNRHAERKANDALQQLGKALPCSVVEIHQTVGACIVTVKFEVMSGFTLPNVTIPHAMGEWIRYPVQIGDKGVVIPFDSRLNDTNGLGQGKGDLSPPANLTALVFMPVGNATWTPTPDTNKLVMYGQDGVIIKSTKTGANMITITEEGITIHGNVTVTGDVTADGISLKTHKHGGVTTGGGQTGTPV